MYLTNVIKPIKKKSSRREFYWDKYKKKKSQTPRIIFALNFLFIRNFHTSIYFQKKYSTQVSLVII